jgi:branched-chain amino acid transport system substrate-binding protein
MQNNHFVTICTFLFLLFSLSSCSQGTSSKVLANDAWGVITVELNSPILIGVAVTTKATGLGMEGIDQERGVQLAIAERNRVRGFTIELVVEETACTSYGGEAVATKFSTISDSVAGVVGATCSSACSSASTILEDVHMLEISPSCGASELTDPSTNSGLFLRTMYDDSLEGLLSADFAFTQLGAREAAIIQYDNIDSRFFAEAFRTNFQHLGGTIISEEIVNPDSLSFSTVLAKLASAQPDVIYAPLLPEDAVNLTTQMEELHIPSALLGGQHFHSTWFLQESGISAEGVYATGPYVEGKNYQELETSYINQFGETPHSLQYVFAYDATNLLLDAIEQASAVDRNGNLIIGRQTLQRAIFETSAYDGFTGSLTCTTWGNCSAENLVVKIVQDGEWVPIYAP